MITRLFCQLLCLIVAYALQVSSSDAQVLDKATFFEGALLIVGDDTPPIENSAFLVENDRIKWVGRKGEMRPAQDVTRVDLTGKTVMPAIVEAHGHIGFRRGTTITLENYTRENIIDHLQRFAYHGIAAVLSLGTDLPSVSYEVRDELRANPPPDTALYLTGGQGLVMPAGGPGAPLAFAITEVSTEEESRQAVRNQAAKKVDFIKLWVDARGGRVEKLPLPFAAAAIDEAHKHNLRVLGHVGELEDVKALIKAGIDGFAHPPWRSGELDAETVELFKQRPNVVVIMTLWGSRNQIYGGRPVWLDEPLLRETIPPEQIKELEVPDTDPNAPAAWKAGVVPRSVAQLKRVGVPFVIGGDIGTFSGGQFFGWSTHIELNSMVEAGLTPAEAITAATHNSAKLLGLEHLGTVAVGKSADFIVLDANPLTEISNTRRINKVYLRGNEVNRTALRAKWTGTSSSAR